MNAIVVRNGNVDGALRTLKQKNLKNGTLKAARERQDGYLKPGEKRRIAKKEAIKNSHKNNRKRNREER